MTEEQYSVGDVVNGHQWSGTKWEPIQYAVGHVENGHRWNGTSWEPVRTGSRPSLQVTKQPWFWILVLGVPAFTIAATLFIVGLVLGAQSPAYRQGYETAAGVLESFASKRSEAAMSQYVADMLGERRQDLAAFCLGMAQELPSLQERNDYADGCVQAYRDWPEN